VSFTQLSAKKTRQELVVVAIIVAVVFVGVGAVHCCCSSFRFCLLLLLEARQLHTNSYADCCGWGWGKKARGKRQEEVDSYYCLLELLLSTMPYPTKKQRLDGGDQHQRKEVVVAVDSNFVASFDDLSVDVLPNILAFLPLKNIMRSRRINKKYREAVRRTIVPPTDFWVDSMEKYNAMNVMARAMPNLQQISLRGLGNEHKYVDGEDPNEEVATRNAHKVSHDIEIISNFSKLRILVIRTSFLNGRYPFLFNFPLLEKLSINECFYLKWDLDMLAGLPSLKELYCNNLVFYSMNSMTGNNFLTGNIRSLRVLKGSLEKVAIEYCPGIEGNFMDLADFPHLKELNLECTAVTGDIRDIGENDFSSLERLTLPKGVYGGRGYEFQLITDAPDLIRAAYLLRKQRPALSMLKYWYGKLSEDSPDWYRTRTTNVYMRNHRPPLYVHFVEAGSRIGYRWETDHRKPCEVNWLDPEPDKDSSDYAKYIEELQEINSKVNMYKGFYQPPTEEEYQRLCDRFA
jgi:hypothetical protein